MKQRSLSRVLSLVLAFCLLTSSVPAVRAEETLSEAEAVSTEPAETVAAETGETAQSTEATEMVTEEPEETAAPETVVTVPPETAEETEIFPGLPEGYALGEGETLRKQASLENGFPELMKTLTAGKDYVADEIVVYCDTEEEADVFAQAFGGRLRRWARGIALIGLSGCSVAEAVEAALGDSILLPAAEPNFIRSLPEQGGSLHSSAAAAYAAAVPQEQDWYSWVRENGIDDPWLQDPSGSGDSYQWLHEVVDSYAAWGVTIGAEWLSVAVIADGLVDASDPEFGGRVYTHGTAEISEQATLVAEVIAGGMDNGFRGAGVAPGVILHSFCAGTTSFDLAQSIMDAADQGVSIITVIEASCWNSDSYQMAVDYASEREIPVIAAAGDDGSNKMMYPAACDGVIAVAALDRANARAWFSGFGSHVDLSAPGFSAEGNGHGSGVAAGVVAGAAALYMSAEGIQAGPAELLKVLKASASKVSGTGMGAGIINAAKLLGGKPEAPYYEIWDYNSRDYISGQGTVPCEAEISFYQSEEAAKIGNTDETGILLVTTDGKNPSVRNGQVTSGEAVYAPYDIDLAEFAGSSVTIKAAWVSGMGVMGSVATVKLKVDNARVVTGMTEISGPEIVGAGKSYTYTTTVLPEDTANQSVIWSIPECSDSMKTAKISKDGKLTTPKGQEGWLVLWARSAEDPDIGESLWVEVLDYPAIEKVVLSHTSASMYAGEYKALHLTVEELQTKEGYSFPVEVFGVKWTSSNTKVALVDENGYVTAVGSGSATITCTSLDGSGKTAKCKITVLQPVNYIGINGPAVVPSGGNATYKAQITPSNAKNKTVTWSLLENTPGVEINEKTGKVTVSETVPAGQKFWIVAESQDGFAENVLCVTVQDRYSGLSLAAEYDGLAAGLEYDKKNVLKTATLYSVDLAESEGRDDTLLLRGVIANCREGMESFLTWSSSNPAVASVDPETGAVTAHKAGTAKITVTAADGSGKKAVCSVKVQTPASSVTLASNGYVEQKQGWLAVGKSAKHTVVYGTTYGNPTVKKVQWSWQAYILDTLNQSRIDLTESFADGKLITLSTSGVLTVKKGVQAYLDALQENQRLYVAATAALESGTCDSIAYQITGLTTRLTAQNKSLTKQISEKTALVEIYADQETVLTATSSKPEIAGVDAVCSDCEYREDLGVYVYRFAVVFPGKTGTAKLTIKTADGSNKSCTVTLKVTP